MKHFSTILVLSIALSLIAFGQIPTTNLKLHLKADAGTSTTTDGVTVSSWADQSGNDNNATAPGTQPIYKTNIINGNPVIRFDGGFTYMALPAASTLGIQNSNYEIFIIAKTSSNAVQFIIGGNTEQYELHLNGPSGARFIPTTGTFIDQENSGAYSDGDPHMYNMRVSSTSGTIRVDGVDGGTTSTDVRSSNGDGLVLGVRAGGAFYFNGDIAEVIIYNTVLSSVDRITVEKYLADKYGMAYSNFAVNSTADVDTGTGNVGTLRYLMNKVNTNASSSTSTIDMTSVSGTITLTSALPPINYNTTIIGPGQNNLTISGTNLYRPFFVGAGTSPFTENAPASPTVIINDFAIKNGKAKGGIGGGGAAGMGGGLFLNSGNVTVSNMLFEHDSAIGGNAIINENYGGGGFGGNSNGSGDGGSGGELGGAEGVFAPFVSGASGGIGAGGAASIAPGGAGGSGGFGAGGGNNANYGYGGYGGFGGGGGRGLLGGQISVFGGGAGNTQTGGGGAGMGGAIFNRNGTLIVSNSIFNNNGTTGGTGSNSGGTYGGAIFNFGGLYSFQNITYGTGGTANGAANQPDTYIYSGAAAIPDAQTTAATNVTSTSAAINGTVNTRGLSTTYRFVYGTVPSSLSDTLSTQNAGSSGTVNVSANISGLSYATFYFYRILATNSEGSDTSSLGSFIYDTTISTTNLKLWLSAETGLDSAGGILSAWYDRSGNSNNATQTVSGNRPAIVSNIINGNPVIRFNGSSSNMNLPSAANLGIQNSDYEMFVVMKSSSSALQFLIGTVDHYELQLNGGQGIRYIPSGPPYVDQGSDNSYTTGAAHIVNAKATSTKGMIRVDGEAGGYSLTDRRSASASNLVIGSRSNGIYYFNGDIAEVIIYNMELSTAQRLAITEYLSQKYSIAYTTAAEPTVQATAMSFSSVTDASMNMTVTKGNGARRIILAKSGSAVDGMPSDGQAYTANAVFGSGSQIGSGNYVVYNGTDSIVSVTGLAGNTAYHFAAFEYNGSATEEDYLTTSPAIGNQTTNFSAPIVFAISPSNITMTTATLRGLVNPKGAVTTYRFAYGTDANTLADTTSAQSAGSGSSADTVSYALADLTTGSVYYAKLLAGNDGGVSVTGVIAFAAETTYTQANLKLWLRADAGTSTTTDGNALSSWIDVSGNGNDASQSNGTSQPLYKTNIFNGKPVVRFDGSNDYILSSSTEALGIINSEYEVFIVLKTNANDLGFIMSAANEQFEVHINGGSGIRYIPKSSMYVDYGTANQFHDENVHLFGFRASSTTAVVRTDGADGTSSGADGRSGISAPMRFGNRFNDAYYLNGDIAEILIYNRVLESEERTIIESALSEKYNITSGALPVELVSFTVSSKRLDTELEWKTATEVNNYGFEIQRSEVGSQRSEISWVKSGFVEGNGTSNAPKGYSFTDKNLSPGKYLYRLKQIDRDGKFSYSQEVEVEVGSVPKVFVLEQNYPNPFNPTTTIGFTLQEPGMTMLKIYDLIGREVATLVNENLEAGVYHQVTFNASNIASGIYFARLQNNGKQMMKKLLLVK